MVPWTATTLSSFPSSRQEPRLGPGLPALPDSGPHPPRPPPSPAPASRLTSLLLQVCSLYNFISFSLLPSSVEGLVIFISRNTVHKTELRHASCRTPEPPLVSRDRQDSAPASPGKLLHPDFHVLILALMTSPTRSCRRRRDGTRGGTR